MRACCRDGRRRFGVAVGVTLPPRRASGSRGGTSIWALARRRSAAAALAIAAESAGSRLRAKAFLDDADIKRTAIPVRIERSRDAGRSGAHDGCLDFARHERVLANQ